ncbi:MAG: TIGR02281 family clan AA aspartic protease [Brevundimonas sp.]|uniref:TIGR02281 family clan AA aspartic protease n=1 Tax=Brevundimonas sp. TaxID=1871086 RepID=UPI00391C4327
MARFDFQSGVMFTVALGAAGAFGYGVSHLGDAGRAQAAPALMVASAPATAAAGRVAQIARADDGHYWAEADINGRAVRVLVDTGATVVALTRDDALRLGFMLESDDFDHTVITANGEGRAARIELAHVAVAGARVERVQALVVERGLPASLLGMSYLGRLSRIEATPHGLTLRP